MSGSRVIVVGGTGLIGSAVCAALARRGDDVVSVDSRNYAQHAGAEADVLVNCNGNSYRFKAAQNPQWDFEASVLSVERTLFDFRVQRYVFISTIDVYNDISDPSRNHEGAVIDPARLHPYGFHKWLAERLVERFAKQPLILRTGTAIGAGVRKGPLYDLIRREPLHMSPDSELSLIDVETIAAAIVQFISEPLPQTILNLTGTGFARLRTLCAELALDCAVAPGSESVEWHYNINNDALRASFNVDSSYAMAGRFLAGERKS